MGSGGAGRPRLGRLGQHRCHGAGLNVLAGVWLIIAPFVLGYGDGNPYWNDVVFGAIVGILALIRISGAYRKSWLSWINIVIGVWIFASAFSLDNFARASVNDVILGVIVFFLGPYQRDRRRGGHLRRAAVVPPLIRAATHRAVDVAS